jgi:hypothetical protein
MKTLAFMLLLSLLIGACVAFCYRREIEDFQAYTKENLQPKIRGNGQAVEQ